MPHPAAASCGNVAELRTARGASARELRGQHLCSPGELAAPKGELPRHGLLDTACTAMGTACAGEALIRLSGHGSDAFALPCSSMLPDMNHLQGGRIWSATSSPSMARFCITSPCKAVPK